MRHAILTFIVVAILAAAPAWADGLSAERVRALVERGEILTLEEILKRNESSLGGRIIEIEIEQKGGTYVYEIKVLRADGRYRELKIDARTATLLREE
ncbi:MAG: PepSY domain-containing protein [Hyphomicrobiaceae bacterium]